MEALETLDLTDTRVSDRGLSHLARLKRVKRICLKGTMVTEEGAKGLKDSLPDASIQPAQ
jgi:hypothetical protein